MLYDHREKAGNLGDVFKHLALVSMLHDVLPKFTQQPFKFIDLFTGYPEYLLTDSGSWQKGLGKITPEELPDTPVIKLWTELALPCLQDLANPRAAYPGAAALVRRMSDVYGVHAQMTLLGQEPAAMAAQQAYHRGAEPAQHIECDAGFRHIPECADADFIFMTPASLRSERFPDFPSWLDVSPVISMPVPTLVWLPLVNHRKLRFEPGHHMIRELAVCMGMQVTEIGWKGRNMIGCQILYRGPRKVVQQTAYTLTLMADYFANCRIRHFPNIHNIRSA